MNQQFLLLLVMSYTFVIIAVPVPLPEDDDTDADAEGGTAEAEGAGKTTEVTADTVRKVEKDIEEEFEQEQAQSTLSDEAKQAQRELFRINMDTGLKDHPEERKKKLEEALNALSDEVRNELGVDKPKDETDDIVDEMLKEDELDDE